MPCLELPRSSDTCQDDIATQRRGLHPVGLEKSRQSGFKTDFFQPTSASTRSERRPGQMSEKGESQSQDQITDKNDL